MNQTENVVGFLEKGCGSKVFLSVIVKFAVVLGFALERRRKCGLGIFCLLVNRVV